MTIEKNDPLDFSDTVGKGKFGVCFISFLDVSHSETFKNDGISDSNFSLTHCTLFWFFLDQPVKHHWSRTLRWFGFPPNSSSDHASDKQKRRHRGYSRQVSNRGSRWRCLYTRIKALYTVDQRKYGVPIWSHFRRRIRVFHAAILKTLKLRWLSLNRQWI